MSQKNILTLACCLALLIASAFYILFCSVGDGVPASPEPDQTLYLQYARNIALGQPYVFSLGDAPSTGSTTHLYPFVLATCYKLGAHDDALFTASFVLNSVFYLLIALLSWLIAKKLYPKIALLALFISLISGHTVAAVFSQTDIGFFAVLALAAIAATLYEKKGLMLGMVVLCALTRPEGAIFSMAYLMTGAAGWILGHRFEEAPGTKNQSKWFAVCGLAGLVAFGGTLMINHMLTGYAQFMSVSNKGYFNLYPFFGAAEHTLRDLMSLIKGFLFGLVPSVREFYHVPLIAGLLGIAGILLFPRNNKKIRLWEFWLLLCIAGSLATIASSQWQGLSSDRYLGWIFPVWTWYILIGTFELNKRLNSRFFLPVCCTLLVGFQLLSLAFIFSQKYSMASYLHKQKVFAKFVDSQLEPGATLASASGGCGILYYMPNRKLYNLHGILSPDFFDSHFRGNPLRVIDRLKHRPDLRFDYWLATTDPAKTGIWAKPLMGETIMMDIDTAIGDDQALTVYAANWDAITGGDSPVLVDGQLDNLKLIDSLDVGYCPDERAHGYNVDIRPRNTAFDLCHKHAKLGNNDYSEVGRIIMGSESFTIQNTVQGKPVRLVLRTSKSAAGQCYVGRQTSPIELLEMNDSIILSVWVNGVEVASPTVLIEGEGFREVVLDIPASFVTGNKLSVEISGDHISYAYWFYQ